VIKTYSHQISNEIFSHFPGYLRGVVVAGDLTNGPSPESLLQLLREAEASVRSKLSLETLIENPHIQPWREAFRSFGAKPSEFRPSIEGLARRALRSDPLPAINALVDIGNIISLRHLLPVGGHSIDDLQNDMLLRLASGAETFVAFGSDQVEHPLAGEVIFAEGQIVLTRRWTWRQGNHTLTLPETSTIEINVDGLPPVTPVEIELACRDVVALVSQFCGGQARFEILSEGHPQIELSL
jgi:DNA/RNA-binding domain of Phe-tRNA-synthetase-like protein